MIEGKKEAAKVYEDDKVVAFLPSKPAGIGHILVVPKKHAPILETMSDDAVEHAFLVTNRISVAVFEAIKSEGTNIIVHNGIAAGQETPHFSINIITRREGDGLSFEWAPKQLGEEEMATVELQLKEEMQKPAPKEEKKEEAEEKKEIREIKKEDNPAKKDDVEEQEESYLLRQLRRMP
jgi:diadenosine tetraphosphate (Ap4A) HIT family hydrolase